MSEFLSNTSNRKFSEARSVAFIRNMVNFFKGQTNDLLPFHEVRTKLSLNHRRDIGLQEVELDKIVGSVGRYHDFTREFFPLSNSQETRWRRIYDLTHSLEGFPSVQLYKVGDVYFVRDGNHRVSVARSIDSKVIEAYVVEYITPVVELSTEDSMDDVLIKAGEANFLQVTGLDKLRPQQAIHLTNPGRYHLLLNHINAHKYWRETECNCEISYQEAVASWYDRVYLPLIEKIRERDILKHFPERTEADLYAWLVLHREALEEQFGLGQVDDDEVVEDLAEEATASPLQKIERAIKRKLDPDSLPPPVE